MYWGRTNAVQLRLSVDRRCPKYEGEVSKHKGKRKVQGKVGGCEGGKERDSFASVLRRWLRRRR
jgi:hypothetical protein